MQRGDLIALRRRLLRWYRHAHRRFPWRATHDPYRILISEVMLQQTQAARAAEKYGGFLKRFPSLRVLAAASIADVIRAWRGMGYNNRAVRLRELAVTVVNSMNGHIPQSVDTLEQLPGIGKYTAHAIASFAYRQDVPVVDVNIRRVLSRIFWRMGDVHHLKDEKIIWQLAARILPRNSEIWTQALMELGARICTHSHPACSECPVALCCRSRNLPTRAVRAGQADRTRMMHSASAGEYVPRRIWRGRIVEALRHVNGEGPLTPLQLGRLIKPGFRTADVPWLAGVLQTLQNDGLVHYAYVRAMPRVSLPEG